ncbi:hypothetical protein [Sinomicrobium weinanense]|uniref:Energy transducer TonB n=1 Tax=Sinomicrobium weinanense TaxID=2842200 RepID=A0A926JUH7_9FLAO|nr:hypothetical protein [Sinomicrobium weinanense]MBC9797472.1 hypothetical protein [Sinomicrobium weinanense]MBU3124464.1 hypothetical protein [Sinomicrobium weinanense]
MSRKQLSLLISFLIMMLVVFILFNIHLAEQHEKEILFEMHFEELPDEEEERAAPEENKLQTHMAYNETVTSRFDKETREFKTLEEIEEGRDTKEDAPENPDEETSAEADQNTDDRYLTSETGTSALPSSGKKKQKAKRSDGDNSSDAIVKNNRANTNSSISYSLAGRTHRILPNPVYTCTSRGKIVINIKVNALGHVTEATFNKRSSTTSNGCLVDHAIAYALRATFNRKDNKSEQTGTITYLFQG